jgi:tripartite-type tricarboxylate transporter receptor subunit TctC
MRIVRPLALACVAALALGALPARADVDKPVRLLVGFAPGGSADIAARLIADRIKGDLHQPVVVENRPGAGGRLVADVVKNAPADGSVLMLTPIVVTVLAPMVFSKLSYDPVADFAPVAQVANFQFALSVNANHPAKTMQELVAWYKANPSKANYGSPAAGSLPHFFGVMIARGTGVDLIHVPYNGGGPMMNALIGGDQIAAGIDTLVEHVEQYRAGRVRILATSGATRSPLLPEVPTFTEAGLAGIEGTAWFGVYAPAKTPDATVRQLNAAINKALASGELRERLTKLGLEPAGGSPADLSARMAQDTARWAPIVKASGFRGD